MSAINSKFDDGDLEALRRAESGHEPSMEGMALSAILAMRRADLAGVAREILRPLLKQWLDENLPSIVERLLRAEIQRVVRGSR